MHRSDEINKILTLLEEAPHRLQEAVRGVATARLQHRSQEEPWAVSDILAHLRACSDCWSVSIIAMLTQDNPTLRYVSPRSWMKKPKYADETFANGLSLFTQERKKLVQRLTELDETGWARPGTFTGTSARQRNQTIKSYAARIVNHEQPHLEQIEQILNENP